MEIGLGQQLLKSDRHDALSIDADDGPAILPKCPTKGYPIDKVDTPKVAHRHDDGEVGGPRTRQDTE